MNRFEESKHPRDKDGQFTNNGGGNSGAGEAKRIFELAEKYGIEYNKDTSYQTVKARVEQAERKNFIDVQLFAPGIKNQSEKELKRSLKSYTVQRDLHKDKIQHPEKYLDAFRLDDENYVQGIKIKWAKEVVEHQRRIDQIKERLKNDFGRRNV